MKDVKNQYIRTGATIIVLSFLGTLGLSILAPQPTQNGEDQMQSYRKAKVVGQTIAIRLNDKKSNLSTRGPASAESSTEAQGYMGTNEEGQPYHYSVLQTDAGVARVVVRTGGPKGQVEYVEEGGREVPVPRYRSSDRH